MFSDKDLPEYINFNFLGDAEGDHLSDRAAADILSHAKQATNKLDVYSLQWWKTGPPFLFRMEHKLITRGAQNHVSTGWKGFYQRTLQQSATRAYRDKQYYRKLGMTLSQN